MPGYREIHPWEIAIENPPDLVIEFQNVYLFLETFVSHESGLFLRNISDTRVFHVETEFRILYYLFGMLCKRGGKNEDQCRICKCASAFFANRKKGGTFDFSYKVVNFANTFYLTRSHFVFPSFLLSECRLQSLLRESTTFQ